MNHKLMALLLGGLTAGTVSIHAQTASAGATPAPAAVTAPSLSWTFTPTYVSTYMFRGQRLGGQSFEPSLEADYGNLAVGIWSNDPINNRAKVPGQSDPEIDPYASYTFSLDDSFSIQPGFTWYTYGRAPTNQGFYRQTFEPNLAVNYTLGGLKLTPKLYYDFVLREATYEFNAAYAVPLKDLGTELDFNGAAGYYRGTDVVNTQGGDASLQTGGSPSVTNTQAVGRGVATVALGFTF
jgi:Putative MetA-pathway of phenol degradation